MQVQIAFRFHASLVATMCALEHRTQVNGFDVLFEFTRCNREHPVLASCQSVMKPNATNQPRKSSHTPSSQMNPYPHMFIHPSSWTHQQYDRDDQLS